MMSDPQTKADLIQQLRDVQSQIAETVQGLTADQFTSGTSTSWSSASYLKHLILSIKPFAKAIAFPKTQLQSMFGQPERSSRAYTELVETYKARLSEGVKAEDFEAVTPVMYRFPEGITDEKAYLVEVWNDANNRLLNALDQWGEEDLDAYQIPHPAIGLLTIREMLFFTLHHNTLHWHDIQAAAQTHTQESL